MKNKEIFNEENRNTLWRFASTMLADEEEAKDVVQDVLVKAWNHPFPMLNPKAYLIRSVRNACIDRLRNRKYFTEELPELPDTSASEHLYDADLVRHAMKSLTEQQRTILHLKDIEGFSTSELSKTLSIPENQIRVTLSRARKAMKEYIEKEMNYGNR